MSDARASTLSNLHGYVNWFGCEILDILATLEPQKALQIIRAFKNGNKSAAELMIFGQYSAEELEEYIRDRTLVHAGLSQCTPAYDGLEASEFPTNPADDSLHESSVGPSSTVTVTAPQVSNPTPGTRLFPVEHNARRKPLSSAPGSRTTQGSHEDTPPVVHTSHSRQIYILCKYCSRKFYAKQNAKKSLSAAGRNLKSHEDEWHLNPGWGDATWKTRVPVKELAEKCLIPLPLSPQATPADFFEEILTKATHEEEWDTLPDVVQGVLARLFQENETLRKLADTRSLSYQKAMDYDFDKYKLDGDNKTQTPYQKYWSVVVHCLHYFMYPPTTSPSRFDSPEPGSVLNQTRSTSRGDVLSWLNLPKTGGMAFDLAIPSGSTSAGQQSRHHTTPTCDDHPSNASPSLNSDQPMADAP